MKNKDQYEDALDKVARYVSDSKVGIYIFKITNELDIMAELVDIYPEYLELKARATPIKPNGFGGFGYDKCPICDATVTNSYCQRCGQKIDWNNK